MHQSTPFSLLATFPLLTAALWPAPQSVSYGPTVLRLASNFSYTFDGNNIQQCSDLKTAATESQDRVGSVLDDKHHATSR